MAFGWRLHECKHALILVTTRRLRRVGLGVPAGGGARSGFASRFGVLWLLRTHLRELAGLGRMKVNWKGLRRTSSNGSCP